MATLAEYTAQPYNIATNLGGEEGPSTYVSPSLAELDVTNSASFHLDVANNDATAASDFDYDMVFDVTLTENESAVLLNAFMTSNVRIAPDSNATDTETASFTTNADVSALVQDILSSRAAIAEDNTPGPTTTAFWAQGDTISDYLNKQLNAYVNGELSTSANDELKSEATASSALRGGLPTAALTVFVDQDSGVATPDFEAAYTSMCSTCFGEGGANALVRQIPSSTYILYDNGANSVTTGALPLLKSDTMVVGLTSVPSNLGMSPTARTVGGATGDVAGLPNGSFGNTFVAADDALKPPAQTLAVRIKLTTGSGAFNVASSIDSTPAGKLKKARAV
jgi:hypothetical protein